MSFKWLIDTVTCEPFRPLSPELQAGADKILPSFRDLVRYKKNMDRNLRGSLTRVSMGNFMVVTQVMWYFQFRPKIEDDWIARVSATCLQDLGIDVVSVGCLTWDDPAWRPLWLAVTPQGLAEFLG